MMFASGERDARNWQVEALGLQPLIADPQYVKDGYLWFRDDLNLIYCHLDGAKRAIPLLGLDGKILDSQLPDLALGETFVVSSEAAMLALSAQKGDIAIRTDVNKSFILAGSDPTSLSNWQELVGSNSAPVQSVNGFTGDVVLTTSDIAEGVNLYYTDTRFDVRFATKSTTDLAEGTNLYYTSARFNSAFSTKSTSDLVEGSNLYFTAGRFNDSFNESIATKTTSDFQEGTTFVAYDSTGDFADRFFNHGLTYNGYSFYKTRVSEFYLWFNNTNYVISNTLGFEGNAFEGSNGTNPAGSYSGVGAYTGNTAVVSSIALSNLYYTDARVDAEFDVRLATKTTSDLSEGTNLYYTSARFSSDFSTKTTDNLTEGGTNLYYTDARVDARIATQKGAVNGIASLDGSGKVPSVQLPAFAVTNTFVVSSQAAMLATSAEIGDIAVRTDLNRTYILTNDDPTMVGNWQELLSSGAAPVQSVNGFTGTVVLTTTNIAEGTNLYYTAARFNTAFSSKTTTDLAEGTNLYYTQARFDSAFAAKSTTNLTEGTNLYYTQARFDSAFAAKSTTNLTEGTNLYYTQARFDSAFAAKSTTNLSEGTNLYYTNARVDAEFDVRLATKSTSDLAEGSNLYYTDARVATKIAATFVDKETPSGTVDGSNTDFALANTPIVGSEHVYLNGLLQSVGMTEDYTISGFTISFTTAPLTGSKIRVSYRK